jgi:hypothetical protein
LPSLVDGPPDIQRQTGKAMKSSWRDPTDTVPTAARTAREVTGHRAYCPLRWCQRRHGARSSFSADHVAAADRLRLLFDGSRLGFNTRHDIGQSVNEITYRRPLTGPGYSAMKQLTFTHRFVDAWNLFDEPARQVLAGVVLNNRAVGPTARTLGLTPARCTAILVEALDLLCRHFDIRGHHIAA